MFHATTLASFRVMFVQETLRAWHGMLGKYVSEEENEIVNGQPFVVSGTL